MRKIFLIVLVHSLLSLNTSYAQLPIAANGKFMEVNKAKLYYEEYGQGEPLFLLHGFLGSTEDWKGFVQEYSKTYKVIVWDMRGHGRSSYQQKIVTQHLSVRRLQNLDLLLIKIIFIPSSVACPT